MMMMMVQVRPRWQARGHPPIPARSPRCQWRFDAERHVHQSRRQKVVIDDNHLADLLLVGWLHHSLASDELLVMTKDG